MVVDRLLKTAQSNNALYHASVHMTITASLHGSRTFQFLVGQVFAGFPEQAREVITLMTYTVSSAC